MKASHLLVLSALLAAPAGAVVREERSPAVQYVRARAADAAGMPELAAAQYAQVLAVSPDDEMLVTRAYRQAITAGDRALAVRAGRLLAARGNPPPDVSLLLLAEAVMAKDMRGANQILDRIGEKDLLSFLVPSLRAWLAVGAKGSDPLAKLDANRAGSIGAAYAGEQRMLILFALGREDEGLIALQALGLKGDARAARLRLAAAAAISGPRAKDKGREKALALLAGDNPAIVAGRRRLEAGKPLPGAIDTPAAGIAELLTRIAIDINRERVTPLALGLARIATFLAPDNAESWLVTGELLSMVEQYEAAATALGQVQADDPFAGVAREARLQLLVRKGEKQGALEAALAAAKAPDAEVADWTRVGDLYAELGRQSDAAAAYGKAIEMVEKGEHVEQPWTLWLLRGGAMEQAGDWPAAKAVLQKALAMAPDQPAVLNYLGYAQLERHENLDEAERLIERASRLKPDDAAITDSLGWVYYQRGNLPQAIAMLERAVIGDPAEPTINEHLGDAYWTVGRRYEARYAWAAALVYADAKEAARINRKLAGGLDESGAKP
jgi:tetratricopeptide (TPR) repeat protein